MNRSFDIAIIGSGFGGSLMAMVARRLGLSVVLLEKGRHPRFAIGESSTPIANLLLEDIAAEYNLPRLSPLAAWGTWQTHYPILPVGLKRGFSFYQHTLDDNTRSRIRQQLLVAASPNDRVADTHWYRPDFDAFLVREAQEAGVEYIDCFHIENVSVEPRVTIDGRVTASNQAVHIEAQCVIDASGPRGVLHRFLKIPELPLEQMPATEALFSHFEGVAKLERFPAFDLPENETAPYALDDAAVHHVFDGGWIWVLRFNNGVTSAGVAARSEFARHHHFPEGEASWKTLLGRLPRLRDQFQSARPIQPFRHLPSLGFRTARFAGPNWALLPSAGGFVDPILSTGFALTLLGIQRLGAIFQRAWQAVELPQLLEAYHQESERDLLQTQLLVGAVYANFDNFEMLKALSFLYFAAASFGETNKRLNRAPVDFLLRSRPEFSEPFQAHCLAALKAGRNDGQRGSLIDSILETIEPFDIAGLSRQDRRAVYPVDFADLLNNARKVGRSKEEAAAFVSAFA